MVGVAAGEDDCFWQVCQTGIRGRAPYRGSGFLCVLRVEERGEMSREVIVQILGVLIFIATIVITIVAVTVQITGNTLH